MKSCRTSCRYNRWDALRSAPVLNSLRRIPTRNPRTQETDKKGFGRCANPTFPFPFPGFLGSSAAFLRGGQAADSSDHFVDALHSAPVLNPLRRIPMRNPRTQETDKKGFGRCANQPFLFLFLGSWVLGFLNGLPPRTPGRRFNRTT